MVSEFWDTLPKFRSSVRTQEENHNVQHLRLYDRVARRDTNELDDQRHQPLMVFHLSTVVSVEK